MEINCHINDMAEMFYNFTLKMNTGIGGILSKHSENFSNLSHKTEEQ